MRNIIKGAIIAFGLTGAALLPTGAANASGSAAISLNFGNVAFAYSDGYWDNSHRWHRWNNANEQRSYQKKYHSSYHSHRHDRDKDHGWHRN